MLEASIVIYSNNERLHRSPLTAKILGRQRKDVVLHLRSLLLQGLPFNLLRWWSMEGRWGLRPPFATGVKGETRSLQAS